MIKARDDGDCEWPWTIITMVCICGGWGRCFFVRCRAARLLRRWTTQGVLLGMLVAENHSLRNLCSQLTSVFSIRLCTLLCTCRYHYTKIAINSYFVSRTTYIHILIPLMIGARLQQ